MSTASQLRPETLGDWEVSRRVADREREVYTAKHRSDGTLAVLVVVDADKRVAAELTRDVERCRTIDHPGVARVLDHFEDDDGRIVIAFEQVEGTSLLRLMKYFAEKNEGLGDRAVLHVGALVVEALASAHQMRDADGKVSPVVHGQLGPHQVLLSWEGEVKVSGLGLAAAFGGTDDEPEWLHAYMAPEVRAGGPMTARANVYTAGAILWTLFSHDNLPVDGERPPPLRRTRPDLPASITFPIDRAMEPANKRISAKALAVSLSRTLDSSDREELRWAMEVCRVRVAVEEELVPHESFPPKKVRSIRAMSSKPPDSEWPTAKMDQKELLDEARIIGPLPWEKGARDPEGTDVIDTASLLAGRAPTATSDAETTDADADAEAAKEAKKRKIPRPSKARRSVERRRRNRTQSTTDAGIGGRASDAPAKRRRAITKRGLNELIAPPQIDEMVTMPAPAATGHVLPMPQAGPDSGPPSGSHIVDAGYQSTSQRPPAHASGPSSSPHGAGPQSSPTGAGYAANPGPYPSYHHPASQYPSSQYPQGPPSGPASHVPLSYAPGGGPGYPYPHSTAPGHMPGVYATTPPTKWIVAVAITAVGSFAAGLLIAGISGVQVQIGERAVAASAPPQVTAAPSVAPPAPPPVVAEPSATTAEEPAPDESSEPEATEPAASASASAAPDEEPPATSDPEDGEPDAETPPEGETDPEGGTMKVADSVLEKAKEDAKGARPDVGVLLVRTTQKDAWVYVSGRPYSKAGQPFQVVCGPHHIRLGDANRSIWYDPGQSITIACRGFTDLTILPRPAPPPKRRMSWPPPALRGGQFLK